ncbi:MAG: arabinosyltransferase domain-containing protein [Gordonia sp. (in: high G+C Gram-positive bacteria)]
MTDSATPTSPAPDRQDAVRALRVGGRRVAVAPRRWLMLAAISGALAVLAAVVSPVLPVNTHTAAISWAPRAAGLDGAGGSVTAPLVAQSPAALDLVVPGSVLRSAHRTAAADGASVVVVSTMPKGAPRDDQALFVTATADTVRVTVRGTELAQAAAADLARVTQLHVWSAPGVVDARFTGLPATPHDPTDPPQVSGLFTAVAVPDGMRAHLDVDNRFDTSASLPKLLVLVIGVLAALVAFAALAVLDIAGGYHRRVGRLDLRRLLRPRAADLTVTAVLVGWHFLGAGSSDDGYILDMGRTSGDAGYLANYYRFFGAPEAPFDWYYDFLAHWSSVSTAGIWMRLPALIAGLASWFVLSRILLPRLGGAVRRSQWAMFTAAAVFIAFWMAFNSGLRSEPIIVLGSLLTWWGVEQAIATRRMLPAAGATLAAALTLAVAPHGLIAVALLLAGSRPMLRVLRRRAHEFTVGRDRRWSGPAGLIAPIAAAAAIVVIIVFRDQTAATIAEGLRIRYTVGPTLAWYQEFLRFYFLTLSTQDGALVRRVPVLLLLASLCVTIAVMLRRKHIRGVDPGPTWRLMGAVLLTVLLLSFTPTKWTVQFGIYAGLGAAMAATATVAVAESARRAPRNLCMYIAGLFLACAVATAGQNGWGWGYDFGIAWFDKAPVIAGQDLSTLFLVLTVAALAVAMWFHLRIDIDAERGRVRDEGAASRTQMAIASSPLAVIAALVVLVELLLFIRAAVARSDTYTTFGANVRALTGDTCAMADDVLVEPDANAGTLAPIGTTDRSRALAGESTGFTPDGVADDLTPESSNLGAGTINTGGRLARPFSVIGGPPGTIGGTGPVGVNGSHAALPFGLDPARTPVLGSYGHDNGTAELTSLPYRLPARAASPLIVISAAGPVFSTDADGVVSPGRSLRVEFGRVGAASSATGGTAFTAVGAPYEPIDPSPRPNRPWRNLRIPMSAVPAQANALRIVAVDDNLSADEWLAITPPRAPVLRTLQDVVGSADPVLLDLTVGAAFPCQRPVGMRNGIAEIPRWRIVPDQVTANSKSKTWQAAASGGLLTAADALTKADTVATYLDHDWHRDWGGLQRLTPLVPTARPAAVTTAERRTWGWTRNGSIRVVAQE